MEELIRVLLDGGKIDSVNQPYIEKILRNLGKTLSDIEKQTPIVDFRYSKEYRTEALDELYNEFTLHAKKSVETIFSKTFDYTSARNELLATPGQMRKRRVQATINPPKNAHLIDELSRARNGTGPSGPPPPKAGPPPTYTPPPTPPSNPLDNDEAPPPRSDQIRVSVEQFLTACKELKVPSNITRENLKEVFRNLAKEYHPDKNPNNPEMFVTIKTAYDTILKFKNW